MAAILSRGRCVKYPTSVEYTQNITYKLMTKIGLFSTYCWKIT